MSIEEQPNPQPQSSSSTSEASSPATTTDDLPFVLKALGFTLTPIDPTRPPPWDTTHLLSRNYTLIDLSQQVHPSDPDTQSSNHEDHSNIIFSLPKFPKEQIPSWYNAIIKDTTTFPWHALHALYATKYTQGEITIDDFRLWALFYSHFEDKMALDKLCVEECDEVDKMRYFINEMILLIVAADYRWNFPEAEDFLKSLGVRKVPLVVGDVVFLISVNHGEDTGKEDLET